MQKRVIDRLLSELDKLKVENSLLKNGGRTGQQLLNLISESSPIKLRWDLNSAEIVALAKVTCAKVREEYAAIAACQTNPTFANTIQAMSDTDTWADVIENMCTFPQHTSPDKELRDASTEAENLFNDLGVECAMNYEVYKAVAAYAALGEPLEGEAARLLERTMRDYKRNGLTLDEEKRGQVKAIKEEMNRLGTDFAKNLGEENAEFEFSADELKGLPADFLEPRKKDGSEVYTVSLKYPDYIPVMKYCSVSSTRQKMEKEFNSRCKDQNATILERLVALRQDQADLLGYSTHAEYVLETRMAKSPKVVVPFLQDLAAKLTPLQQKEVEVCLAIKKEEEGGNSDFVPELRAWDISYYSNKVAKRDYKVDQQEIKQYFPIDVVTEGLLEIYQELLSLKFTQVTDPDVWHEDVLMYEVRDDQAGGDNSLVGFFYMDMYPRDGKYGHAACFGLQASCSKFDGVKGSRQLPIAAMVCNFSKPEVGRPSLLLHSEVETFFHEFGHVMHQLCSVCDYVAFAGTRVERDFVEAPSQMLENWCWQTGALERLSGHIEDKSRKMPAALVETLLKAKLANCGILNKRQLLLGTFDQRIHSSGASVNTADVLATTTRELTGLEMTPGTNMSASFGHLAGGYDAQYYGYMWSEVYSADMFESRFKKEGIFDKQAGLDYRTKILGPGGSKDAIDLLRDFLGREPNSDAFLKSKGL
jgi:thimet oligopeptidase